MTQEMLSERKSRGWVLLPLRLFLSATFIYAGIQKLTDPQFFQPTATSYIGNQIAGFAINSPLRVLLLQIAAPHAVLFGLLIAYGEIAIGFGTLFGLLFRLATLSGLLLSLLFFLTATWHVYPYFYGSDIVFSICWITLFIHGPVATGLPTIDELFRAPQNSSSSKNSTETITESSEPQ